MMNGSEPSISDMDDRTIFHLLSDRGNLEALDMVINYFYFDLREYTDEMVKKIQREFGIKKSDVRKGKLISPDKHIIEVQERFNKFMDAIHELYIDYLRRVSLDF